VLRCWKSQIFDIVIVASYSISGLFNCCLLPCCMVVLLCVLLTDCTLNTYRTGGRIAQSLQWLGYGLHCSITGMLKRLFSCPKRPEQLWDSPNLQRPPAVSFPPGITRPGLEVDHLHPSVVEGNEWSHISTPPICLPGEGRDSYIFYTYHKMRAVL
jgi:hypothetical protein